MAKLSLLSKPPRRRCNKYGNLTCLMRKQPARNVSITRTWDASAPALNVPLASFSGITLDRMLIDTPSRMLVNARMSVNAMM